MERISSSREPIPTESIGMVLKRAEQALLRAKSTALKPVGLTLGQYVALVELDRRPGITAATLARACLVTPQAMMVLLKSMEEQGLVVRSQHPRHANVLEINMTKVGRESLHTAREQVQPVEDRIVDRFSHKDLKLLRKLLSRFIDSLASG